MCRCVSYSPRSPDEEEMKEGVKMFWEDIGGVSKIFDTRSECLTLDRKDAAALDEWITYIV